MLRYLARNVETIVRSRRSDKLSVLETCSSAQRLHAADRDARRQLRLGAVVTALEMGRMAMLVRTGLWRVFVERKLYPVVAGISLQLADGAALGALGADDFATVTCRLCAWDGRFVVFEQTMSGADGRALVTAAVKAISFVRGTREAFPPVSFLHALGHADAAPARSTVPERFALPQLDQPATHRGRVAIADIDYNLHMNNSRFVHHFEAAAPPSSPPISSFAVEFVRPLNFRQRFVVASQSAADASALHQILSHVGPDKPRLSAYASTTFFND